MTYKYWDQELMSGPLLGKFDVLLRGCYLYKELPFLRVTFIDVEKSRRVTGDGWVEERDVMAKRTELLTAEMNCTSQPRLLTAYVTQPVSLSLSLSLSLSRRVSFADSFDNLLIRYQHFFNAGNEIRIISLKENC